MDSKEFDSCLSDQERRNVAAAYEMIDALRNSLIDPQTGRQSLERLLAEDFVSFTPTSDARRQQRQDKQAFIGYVVDQHLKLSSASRLEIVAHTAHGNRVATEMNSEMVVKSGASVRNRYHQLFLFDSAAKIQQYRTYMDSAAITDSAIAGAETLTRNFVVALANASPDLKKLTTGDFLFHPADGSAPIATGQLLEKMAAVRNKADKFRLDIIEGGMIAEAAVASVETLDPNGNMHSFVLNIQDDRVTSAIEFSGGIWEIHHD